ncbi:AMP-binding enzyme [Seiridium cupressi]
MARPEKPAPYAGEDIEKKGVPNETPRHDDVGVIKHADQNDADEAYKVFAAQGGEVIVITPEEERRLLRKIDLNLMPLLCIVYGLNYLDKTTVSYASVMGIKTDINLIGQDYSWIGSMFYFGYLVWEWPTNRLLQRLPLAKYSAFNVIMWGLTLCCMAAVKNFAGAMTVRFFLGVFESAVSPGFALFTSQWWTIREQGTRTGWWFSFNGWGQILGGFVAYGIAVGTEAHPIAIKSWQLVFLVIGLFTASMGVVFLYWMPDSQLNARFLTPKERLMAVERIRMNQQGVGNKHFKMYQFKEALTDPMIWAFVFYSLVADIPNGGISNFFSQLIVSFGYTNTQSLLLGTPGGAVEVVALVVAGHLGDRFRNRLLISTSGLLIAALGMLLITCLPESNNAGRLVGYYLTQASPTPFVALLSLISTNVAGWTKKTTVAAMYLIGYCVGNIIGPQVFQSKDQPEYRPAEITIIVCYLVCVLDVLFIYFWCRQQNKKKAAIRAAPGYQKLEGQEFLDLTDRENPEFPRVHVLIPLGTDHRGSFRTDAAMSHPQDEVHNHSLEDPESFWAHQAEHLHWHRKPQAILLKSTKTLESGTTHPHWDWFAGGEISTCYNCVDRHVLSGNGDRPAIFYDSPVTKTKQTITYNRLLDEVEVLAGVLRDEGVKKGDVVLIYMPMIPAALIGILAVNRLGAIHAVVFGGFAAASLAQRIEASKPVAILTASCGIDGTKPPISYKPFIREAIELSKHKPNRVLVWQRNELRWDPLNKSGGERNWFKLVRSARARGIKADCVPVKSGDGIYIIYTSGTTGSPKGVVRDAGGHAVGLHLSISYLFGIHGPGDVIFTASDIGWVVGHSFIIYGPLLTGAATVLYEGKPVGTPDSSSFWRIIQVSLDSHTFKSVCPENAGSLTLFSQDYKVNSLFTAPTALRAIKRDDPENEYLKRIGETGGLKSLRAIFLAGERSEPSIITMYQELLQRYGASGATVIDNWWSSESGSPISGVSLLPHAGKDRKANIRDQELLRIKPGSAGKPMPGFDVRAVDDQGNEVKRGKMGNIVMATPLAPTGFRTLWDDEDRFYKGYLKRFDGKWLDTGDAGMIDPEGYISIMSRSDDLINTAGHRLSTGAIEQAITSHPLVAEASVIGIPDNLKGQLPFAFVTLSVPDHPSSAVPDPKIADEIQKQVRSQIGGIATLGGIIQGKGMIPKTRSGKTLRRVLRELVENAVHDEFDKDVAWPATIEDASVIEVARSKVAEYFKERGGAHKAVETRAKL